MMPIISVIMSVYKEPIAWIVKSIDSILAQTFRDFEFIIVLDNPSYINAKELLMEYANRDMRVQIIQNEVNVGLTKSLNKALHISKGEYIARMDADDISNERRFEVQYTFLKVNPSYGLCSPLIDVIDESDNTIMREDINSGNQANLVWECNIVHPGVMMRMELLEFRDPLYNEEFRTSQDYELWTFLTLKNVRVKYLDENLLKYRHSTQQVGNSRRHEQFENFKLIRRSFISKYLDPTGGTINSTSSAIEVLRFIKRSDKKTYSQDYLDRIIYLLYYSLTLKNKRYYISFLFRSRYLFFRLDSYYFIAITRLLWNKITLPKFEY